MTWLMKIENALPQPLRVILIGVGQVIFCGSAVSGFVFLLAFCVYDVMAGLAAVVGAISSTATASVFKNTRSDMDLGLYGFNGTLTGVGLWTFLAHAPQLWLYIILAAMLSSVVFAMMMKIPFRVPPATAPFVLICWIFILIAPTFDPALDPGRDLRTADTDLSIPVSSQDIAGEGMPPGMWPTLLVKGISQIFLADSFAAGVLILVGVAVMSLRSTLLLGGGALCGSLIAALLGADHHAIGIGLYGFNAGLAAIAVGQVFLKPDAKSALLAILASMLTPALQIGLSQIFVPIALPVLAAPFLSVLWAVLFVTGQWERYQSRSKNQLKRPKHTFYRRKI